MAKPYFRQVPNFEYASRNSGEQNISEYISVKNLFKRGKLREDIFGNLAFFEKYSIIGDERPDNVAYKFYGDSTLDWVVLLSNNILNIQTEWPLPQTSFDKVMLEKYGSYEKLYSGIHHYETEEIKNSLGVTVLKGGIRINPTWTTNGNFVKIPNNKIDDISAFDSDTEEAISTVTVTVNNGIKDLEVGDTIIIENISATQYNGKFVVSDIITQTGDIVSVFTYELEEVADVPSPLLTGSEQFYLIPSSLSESINNSSGTYYYEYWDAGLSYSVLVPSTAFIRSVTNYEYENLLQESKRNIYLLKPLYLNVIFNDMDDIMPYKQGSTQYVNATLKRGDNIRLYE